VFLLISMNRALGAALTKDLTPLVQSFGSVYASSAQLGPHQQVSELKLENGLKVLLEEQHSMPLISVGVWYRAGSKDASADLAGIFQLAQGLTYRGSKAFPGRAGLDILEEAGGQWAGHTLRDQSCFLATVPKINIEGILKLEAARMSIDSFSSEVVKKEKDILLNRILSLCDDPKQLLDFEVSATAIRLHPYRWPSEGVEDSIQRIRSDQIWQYYSQYYVPNNAVLVAVGDFDTKQLQEQIQKYFGSIGRKSDPPRISLHELPQRGERRIKIAGQGSIPYLEFAYRTPHILNDDFFVLLMIDELLTGSNGSEFPILGLTHSKTADSWLQKELVEKKLATQVFSQLIPTQESYLYKLLLALPDRFQYQAAEEAFAELIGHLRSTDLTEDEIQRIRMKILNSQILDQEDCEIRAFKLGYFESIASYQLLAELKAKINQITSQDVRRVAAKYFSEESKTIGWFVPPEKKSVIQVEQLQGAGWGPGQREILFEVRKNDAVVGSSPAPLSLRDKQDLRIEDRQRDSYQSSFSYQSMLGWHQGSGFSPNSRLPSDLPEKIQFWRPLRLLAYPLKDSFTEKQPARRTTEMLALTSNPPLLKVEHRVLENGATLIAIGNRAAPTVALCAVIRAGAARDPEGREGTAMFVARMLDRGTITQSAARLSSQLEKLQARCDIQTGYLGSVVSIDGASRNSQELLSFLSDVLRNSAFTQFEMESVKSGLLADLQETESEAEQMLNRVLREKIYPSGHPFKRLVCGTTSSIQRIRLTELDSFYRKNYHPEQFSLIIAGDIQIPQILNAAEKLFGDWRTRETAEKVSVPELSFALDSSNKVITVPEKSLCNVGFGLPGIGARYPDFLGIQVANYILGKGRASRLSQRIREQDGITDFVESGYSDFPGEGPLSIRAKAPLAKLDQLVSAVRSEVERLQKDGVSNLEIESAKKALINAYWVRLRSNRGLAQEFVFSEINQLGQDYTRSYPDLIAGIGKDRVIECVQKYLNFNLGPKVIVGPYEGR